MSEMGSMIDSKPQSAAFAWNTATTEDSALRLQFLIAHCLLPLSTEERPVYDPFAS